MSENRNVRAIDHEAVRFFLLHVGDPIGVTDLVDDISEVQDEYDSYVDGLWKIMREGGTESEVVEYLWVMVTQSMGLCGDRVQTEDMARSLLALCDKSELSDQASGRSELIKGCDATSSD